MKKISLKNFFQTITFHLLLAFILLNSNGFAQDGVGINTTTIDPHAILDINVGGSIAKGIKFPLLPATSAIQDMSGANPGIMFFDSESNQLYNSIDVDNGTFEWDPAGWGMRGTANTDINKHALGTTDNTGLNFITDDQLRIRIRANGKVGIGLTYPTELLEVNGAIKIGAAQNSGDGTIQWTGSDLELYKDSGWISLTNTSSSDNDWTIGNGIVYNTTDNVGIGTTGSNNKQLTLNSSASSSNSYGIYSLQAGTHSGSGYGIWTMNNSTSDGAKTGIFNNVSSIGTGARYGIVNYAYGNNASTDDIYGIYTYTSGSGSGKYYGLRIWNQGGGSGTDYGIYSTGEDINYFEGKIGVGVINPLSKLHIEGGIKTSRLGTYGTYSSVEVQGIWSIAENYKIDVTNDDFGNQYGMGYAYNQNGGSPFASEHQIVFTNNGTINAAIGLNGSGYFSGNVGIGTANAAHKLHVVGSSTLSSVLIAPSITNSGSDSEVLLAEDNDNTYGMSIKYDGNDNLLEVYGKSNSNIYGPHLTIARNSGEAAFMDNLAVQGTLSKGGGSFKIDHPADPENKFLLHSFVESPDMLNIYNGNTVLDANGSATIILPDYFELINKEFKYQLTPIGAAMPSLYISEKVQNNTFKIEGGVAGEEVSWQVTGVRKDPWAEKNRIPTILDKEAHEKGKYLHPELYNMSRDYKLIPGTETGKIEP